MAYNKLAELKNNIIFTLFIAMLFGVLFITRTNPTSETFTCDEFKICTLEQRYILPILNKTTQITLSPDAIIGEICTYHKGNGKPWWEYHLGLNNMSYNNTRLFKKNSAISNMPPQSDIHKYEMVLKQEHDDYVKYINNPSAGYSVRSSASHDDCTKRLYFWIGILSALIVITFFIKTDRF